MVFVVILLGAPGAGKGTQAERLAQRSSLPHVSTGDLFRANLSEGTELGKTAKTYMEAGNLVPDEIVLGMLFDRVAQPDCHEGYLLDGFPRTLPQAEAFDSKLDAGTNLVVFNLAVSDATIVKRAAGRLLCKACGNIQHAEFSPPKKDGVCDRCGGELHQRADDRPEVVRERLSVYHAETAPLVRHYENKGVLVSIDGERAPDEVFQDLDSRLEEHCQEGGPEARV